MIVNYSKSESLAALNISNDVIRSMDRTIAAITEILKDEIITVECEMSINEAHRLIRLHRFIRNYGPIADIEIITTAATKRPTYGDDDTDLFCFTTTRRNFEAHGFELTRETQVV